MVTGIYPTERAPHRGTFIKSQVESLVVSGLDVDVVHPGPGPTPLRYAEAVTRVFFKTRADRFDVIHGHYGFWCLVARLQWTTPVVASFLGTDVMGAPSGDGGYTRKSRLTARVSRWLARHVNAVIVKSGEMSRLTPAANVFVIPNGVDFELFHPMPRATARAALGWDPERYYVLFGNNPRLPVKDFPLAQAAIEHLCRRGITAELVVANGLPQTTLVQYINASNVLLLSSIAEGSPNIVKETMACNVPVVATDVGDVVQVIGRTEGCTVCPRDPEALAAGLERALHRSGPTTGRADIQHLDRSVVARQVIAVYERVMRSSVKEAVGA